MLASTLLQDVTDANVLADRGYDADDIVRQLAEQRCVAVIPAKKNRTQPRPHDAALYVERHLVECFFQKLKRNRRVATRYEKLASRFMAIVTLAAIAIWLA
jgi:transposase